MAQGRTWRNRLLVILAISLYALLVAANLAPNPFPPLWEWVNQERPIAPDLAWQERLGAKPDEVTEAGDGVAIDLGGTGEVRRESNGGLAYSLESAWLTVAGSGDDTVVVAGDEDGNGYQVRDPRTGAVVHRENDAVAVWAYTDALLDLRCEAPDSCGLRRYAPGSAEPVWSADLPGAGGVTGANPRLAGAWIEPPSGVAAGITGREPIPRVLGFAPSRNELVVVDTGTGQVLRQLEAERNEQLSVVGGRIISSVATRRDGICVVSVTGSDATTGRPVWGPQPYHLRTASGSGCEQRHRPQAAGAALLAVDPDGRDIVIDAYDGRVLWIGAEGDRVVALSSRYAIVRPADQTVVFAVELGGDRSWEQAVHEDAEVAVSPCGVVVVDRRPDRLRILDPASGEERLSARTDARAVACTSDGLVIADGRSVGLAPWPGTEPAGEPVGEPAEGGGDVDGPAVRK